MVQTPFDLFKTEGADVHWIAAAPDLATAKEAAREIGDGKYLVLDQATGNKFSIEIDSEGKEISQPIADVPPA